MSFSKNWLPNEDMALVELYQQRHIHKWTRISQLLVEEFGITGKTPKKCRQRYNNHLNPNINRDDWQPHEETLLVQLQKEVGNRWAEISRKLPGRTDNSVKNKFYSKFRKALRNVNAAIAQDEAGKYKELSMNFVYKLVALIDNKYKADHNMSPQLLTAAETLRDDILACEDLQPPETPLPPAQLTALMQQVQWINTTFKRRAPRRRRPKDSTPKQNKSKSQPAPKPHPFLQLPLNPHPHPTTDSLNPAPQLKQEHPEPPMIISPPLPSSIERIQRAQLSMQCGLRWVGWAQEECNDPWAADFREQYSL